MRLTGSFGCVVSHQRIGKEIIKINLIWIIMGIVDLTLSSKPQNESLWYVALEEKSLDRKVFFLLWESWIFVEMIYGKSIICRDFSFWTSAVDRPRMLDRHRAPASVAEYKRKQRFPIYKSQQNVYKSDKNTTEQCRWNQRLIVILTRNAVTSWLNNNSGITNHSTIQH